MTHHADIVCFGLAEWDSPLPTNQHHLARRFAQAGRVLFIDTVGTRRPRRNPADLWRIARRVWKAKGAPREVEPGVWRLSPLAPPPGLKGWRAKHLARSFAGAVRRAMSELRFQEPVGWFFNPRAVVLLEEDLRLFSPVIYHAVDDLTRVPGAAAEEIAWGEALLAARGDLMLASAPPLFKRLSALAPEKTRYLPNVADFDHFHRAAGALAVPPEMQAIPRPRIVFAGNLASSKIDASLLRRMIEARADWQWVLIGPLWEGAGAEEIRALRARRNVRFLGHVPYEELPAHLAGADALIIPYRTDPSTESTSPLKFLEYLATSKPVVSTPLPALEEYRAFVPLVSTPEAFVQELERALAADDPSRREARIALAREHSWERRMEEIDALLSELQRGRGERHG
ncbi:MAG: glycosyltransferase [Candidatus Sumerlaeota bacterium]|nr:glycosyltransferase [Candidatus Sumerlaeota bacterium]